MNPEKPFDERRSAAIKSMLMAGVERSTDPRNVSRRRSGLIAALVAAALVLAGGSAAVAISAGGLFHPAAVAPASPSPGPSTPRPMPTATRVPSQPPTSAAPSSTVPADCRQLSRAGGVALTSPSLSPGSIPDGVFFRVADAGIAQAGVLHCQWSDDASDRYVALSAVADAERGAEDVASSLADGWSRLDIGDAGAWSCERVALACTARIVDDAYWIEVSTGGGGLTAEAREAREAGEETLSRTATALVAALRAHPQPSPAWTPPSTVWDGADCSAWDGVPVAGILGTPGIEGPRPILYGAVSALDAPRSIIGCRWGSSVEPQAPPGKHAWLDVALVPGSAWAWDRRELSKSDVEQMSVDGADEAQLVCAVAEGREMCWLDVLADDSWMRVESPEAAIPGDRVLFVQVAEAVLALR